MQNVVQEIPFSSIPGFRTGHAQDERGLTGCTVFIAEGDMAAGADVRGGGPASRETELLAPTASCARIHALLLSGGSAFGLRAAEGVVRYLEERGRGFDTGFARVPLVCASCLYDLGIGDAAARPDADMAYRACLDAEGPQDGRCGNVGAGCGCTVGKMRGAEGMMKSGLGFFAIRCGEVMVGAAVAVNALGDVFELDGGRKIAGMLNAGRTAFESCEEALVASCASRGENLFTGNTTLAAVFTNAAFDKVRLSKIASMAHNGLARTIRPVHTSADGDTVYALSVGSAAANPDAVGCMAAYAAGMAVNRAVLAARGAGGCPAACDLGF